MAFSAYVFDAYGTLFDVHSAVRAHSDQVGPGGPKLSEVWRAKQLEYSWVRGLMNRYVDFWQLTTQALDFAFDAVPEANRDARQALLDAYWQLECYPEVPAVLTELKATGAKIAILSNGSPEMLDAAVKSSGLDSVLDDIISVDRISSFKANPSVYEMVTTNYRIYPDAVSFQSSNRWDVAAGTSNGFRTVWINRTGQPDEYRDLPPAVILKDLKGLPTLDH